MTRFILTQGIGFNPGGVGYLPTLGFTPGVAVVTLWTRRRELVAPGDRRALVDLTDTRSLTGAGDWRSVARLNC